MRKLIWTLAFLIVIAVFGGRAWWLHQHRKTGDNVVKIGAVLPMSGVVSDSNKKIVTTLNIAKEMIEKNNTLNGKKIKYQFEDGKLTIKDSLSAFNKLMLHKTNANIVLGDVPVAALSGRIKESKIPTLGLVAGTANLTKGNPYLFRAFHANDDLAANNAKFLMSRNADTVGILKIKNVAGDEMAKIFTEEFEKLGGKVLITETYTIDALDVRPQIAKILNKNPKAVYISGFGTGYIAGFNQLKENQYAGIVLTESAVMDATVYSHITNNASGCYFSLAQYSFDQIPEFVEKYKKAIGVEPDIFDAFTWMTMEVLIEAIKRQGAEPEQIRQGLTSLKNFDTIMGKITFDDEGELHLDSLVIRQMQPDGTAKIIKE